MKASTCILKLKIISIMKQGWHKTVSYSVQNSILFCTATIIASHYKIGEKIRLPPRITYASPVQETINGLLILQYSCPKQEAIDGLNMEAKSHNTSHSTYIYSQGIHQYVGVDIFYGFLWGPSQNNTNKPTTVNSLISLHSPRQQ